MDPVLNPHSPGAGMKPAALVGRDDAIRSWNVALRRAEQGRPNQPFILYGLRGVGKTVLLSQLRHDAQDRNWWVVQAETGTGKTLRELVGEGLYKPLSDISRPSAGKRVLRALKTAMSFKTTYDTSGTWSFGLDLSSVPGGAADSGILDTDLRRIIEDDWPLLIALAGLPSLPETLAKAKSYTERFHFIHVEKLSPEEIGPDDPFREALSPGDVSGGR